MSNLQYVGLDVHKETINTAVFLKEGNEPKIEKRFRNEDSAIKPFFQRLQAKGPVIACYEAGCMGFCLHRKLTKMGVECKVVAPTLLPQKPGKRTKTDRRDARKLARNLRAGEVELELKARPHDQ